MVKVALALCRLNVCAAAGPVKSAFTLTFDVKCVLKLAPRSTRV